MTTMKLDFLKLLITLILEVMEGTHQLNLKEEECRGMNVFYCFVFLINWWCTTFTNNSIS